jgi:subtilisin-like proprotein convertase family protein
MKSFRIWSATLLLAGGVGMRADEVFTFDNLTLAVPDGRSAGVADFETVSSGIQQMGAVQVELNIAGNFNGDLYCYLRHDNALSVLLNRPGRTSNNLAGYDDSGFRITLSDSAVNGDIHTYRGVLAPPANTALTGLWQPDGRASSPTSVLDTDARTADLDAFDNLDANGTWTLFVADLAAGGTSVLNQWQLIITPIPEPATAALILLGAGMAYWRLPGRRTRR